MSDTKPEIKPLEGLKPQNIPRLVLFFVLNVIVFIVVFSGKDADASYWEFIKGAAQPEKGVVFLVASLAVIVLDGLIPTPVKNVLVFWRWPHPLPGCRAFTVIAPNHPEMISIDALEKYSKPLPTDPAKQNKLWLNLYEKHQAHPSVVQVHRNFLLTREMTSLSSLFLLLLPLTLYLMGTTFDGLKWIYVGALVVQYLLVALSCRNYGYGFVTVVLVRASSSI